MNLWNTKAHEMFVSSPFSFTESEKWMIFWADPNLFEKTKQTYSLLENFSLWRLSASASHLNLTHASTKRNLFRCNCSWFVHALKKWKRMWPNCARNLSAVSPQQQVYIQFSRWQWKIAEIFGNLPSKFHS